MPMALMFFTSLCGLLRPHYKDNQST